MGNTGITYSIVGPGSSYDNRIKVTVGCGEISAIICYIGRSKFFDGCNYHITDTKICEEVAAPSDGGVIEGTLTWNGQTVYYEVTVECPDIPDPNCVYRCDNDYVKSWATPYYITDDTEEVDVYYEYRKIGTDTNTGELCGVIKKSGHYTVERNDEGVFPASFDVDGCTIPVHVEKKNKDDCTPGTVVTLSVYFTPSVVPASGGTITVNVVFKKVVTDKNCVKKETSGGWGFPWTVTCEATTEDPYKCCVDHMVTGTLAISEIRTKLKLDNDTKIVYNGVDVSNEENIEYSVLQKAKYTDECSGFCEEKTTYCADQSSVKVCYEKEWMSNEWICEGETTDCDCSALSIDGVNGYLSVPFTGGRIKVTWNYSAHTTTRDCQEFDSTGKWEEIIAIGGCDERPTDCNPEYNKVIINAQGGTGVYDNDTYQGCEICDSECCYNYDGNGKCKCVILFKERTPDCKGKTEGGCDKITIYDNQLGREVTYNKIHYEFVQDCTPDCEYNRYINYDKQEHTLAKCFEGSTSYTVSYTAVTEYEGIGCPADTSTPGSEVVSLVVRKNNSRTEKIVYDDERLKVIQEKGPCDDETVCDCDALSVEGGSCVDRTVYDEVHVDCNEHVNESKTVHYRVMCDQEVKSEGDTAITINLTCNSGIERQYTIDGVTVYQAGECDCGQPTGCDCTGHGVYYESNPYAAGGSSSSVKIGSLTYGAGCSSTTFKSIEIVEGGSSIWTSSSDFDIRSNGDVYAIVPANNTSNMLRVRIHFNCVEDGHDGYFNFYQEAGSGGDCKCSVGSRYVGGYGTGAAGDCPANGFPERPAGYVIGYYTKKDCTSLPSFSIVAGTGSEVTVEQFRTLWAGVTTGFTTNEPQYNETGTDELPRKADFNPPISHYITASTIPANPYGYLNMRFVPSCNVNDKINFQQLGGGTPATCDKPNDSPGLNVYLNTFKSLVGANINTDDTPCTYSYLKEGYEYIYASAGSDTAKISWFLANMLSELTPDYNKATSYFSVAAETYGGVPTLRSTDTSVDAQERAIYESRRDGAYSFVLFRRNGSKDGYNAMTTKVSLARNELASKGVTTARLNSRPAYIGSDGTTAHPMLYFKQDIVPHSDRYIPAAPNMTGETGGVMPSGTYDNRKMTEYVNTYETVSSLASMSYRPIYDKQADGCYTYKMFGIPSSSERTASDWETYFNIAMDVQYTASNYSKGRNPRWRPPSCKLNSSDPTNIRYLCDFNVVNEQGNDFCDKQDSCAGQQVSFSSKTSYPSGHASYGYFCSLLYLLASGVDKTGRAKTFGESRNIVAAHWPSDVLIGQVNCSACIGFLLGFKEFQTLLVGGTEPDAYGNSVTYKRMIT